MPEVRNELRHLLLDRSYFEGDFVLASGARSDYYVDLKRTTYDARGRELIGAAIANWMEREGIAVDCVGGLTLGADAIAHALGTELYRRGRPFREASVRKSQKDHGRQRLVEGNFEAGDRVLVLDDVVTTAGSTIQAIEAFRKEGGDVVAVIAVIDRLQGGAENVRALGVPFAARRLATTPEEAATAAVEIGFPVVIKVDGVAHKAREGGVVLGISTAIEAADEARRLGGRVLVARQVDAGAEAICGMTRDPHYGPVLAVGPGGVAVEELDRLTLTVAPVDLEAARQLVAEADVDDPDDVVASTLVALGRLALAHPDVESVDVNPLVLGPGGAVAVDALVVVAGSSDDPAV